jgi:hypothetical protein
VILWNNWLTIVGPKATFERFDKDDAWEKVLRARHVEWLELSPTRHRCEFKTKGRILVELEKLSRLWPRVVFLLDYEWEPKRIKGLVKAKAGDLESCEINY